MDITQLESILNKEKDKELITQCPVNNVFYGTLLDQSCINIEQVQNKYKQYLKPIVQEVMHTNPIKIQPIHPEQTPINKYKQQILQALKESNIIIITGGTGSGKSTQVPKILQEITQNGKLIGCTQPRRTPAVTIAERMQQELSKQEIGYAIRFNTQCGKSIKYMTEGILLREILNNPRLIRYSSIILDEIHERTLESILLLKYLLTLARDRIDLKLIIMTATLDKSLIQDVGICPIINTHCVKYPVKIHFLKKPTDDYIRTIVLKVMHLSKKQKNILVFLTGKNDLNIVHNVLKVMNIKLKIFLLHAKIPLLNQLCVINYSNPKCILTTNISDTSITIPDIKYVIDCGMYKVKYTTDINMIKIVPIQKLQAIQRMGRTGRTCPGHIYRIYTRTVYNTLHNSINRLDYEDVQYISMISIRLNIPIVHERVRRMMGVLEDYKVVEKYNIKNGEYGLLQECKIKKYYGSIGYKLTELGIRVSELPLSVRHSIFIIECIRNNYGYYGIIIVGMMELINTQCVRINELLTGYNDDYVRSSDHILLILMYDKLIRDSTQYVLINDIGRIINQLCVISNVSVCDIRLSMSVYECIIKSLIYSHKYNICIRMKDKYRDIRNGVEGYGSYYSVSHKYSKLYEYYVYDSIISIKQPIINIMTRIPENMYNEIIN
ncbi:pre-mRNA-splicing factor ATP-dependent RNA helicase DHX16 [Nematocida sp. ERTm5]|nr:pre-mRNA-splicing factor ATP-dependent RNA helicase DHX16 [Nematocida sp. ERTm5]